MFRMYNRAIRLVVVIAIVGIVTSCKKDDPYPKVNKFPKIEEIFGSQYWQTENAIYYDSNGNTYTDRELALEFVGFFSKIAFHFEGNNLFTFHSIICIDVHPAYKVKHDFTFDRETGNLYILPERSLYLTVLETDLVSKRVKIRYDYGQLPALTKGDNDKGSYGEAWASVVDNQEELDDFLSAQED